jgi:hypothetical protein
LALPITKSFIFWFPDISAQHMTIGHSLNGWKLFFQSELLVASSSSTVQIHHCKSGQTSGFILAYISEILWKGYQPQQQWH